MVQDTKFSDTEFTDKRANEQLVFWSDSFPSTFPENGWFIRTDKKILYQNTGTENSPTWTKVLNDVTVSNLDSMSDVAGHTHTRGIMLISDGTNWQVLSVGADDQVLTADSAKTLGIEWKNPSTGSSLEEVQALMS